MVHWHSQVIALKPLADAFGIEWVMATTLQAISGAGYPGLPSLVRMVMVGEGRVLRATCRVVTMVGACMPRAACRVVTMVSLQRVKCPHFPASYVGIRCRTYWTTSSHSSGARR